MWRNLERFRVYSPLGKWIKSTHFNARISEAQMGKISGAAKRKKKKEREKALAEHIENLERLKLGPTKLWTGLVVHHRDVFVSHVISKLNRTDRRFFSKVNGESWDVLEYAGVNVSGLSASVYECSSISTLEWAWNNMPWGKKDGDGRCDRSSLVLRASRCNEQTRVSQVGERSETLRVG